MSSGDAPGLPHAETFEQVLTGGHPNSLGRTAEVVAAVLAEPARLADLFACYRSEDAVVRLRTSSALKRVCAEHPDWLVPYLDRLLDEVATLDQASAQWTLAQLFQRLRPLMTDDQQAGAVAVMQRNLDGSDDWIVQNTTMDVLAEWGRGDAPLEEWLLPRLHRLAGSHRKSVAGRARKLLAAAGHRL